MKAAFLLCGLFVCATVTVAQTSEPKAVTPAEASSHLLQRVEPTVPPAGRDVAGGERNEGQQEATPTKFIGNREQLVGRLD
jgi:hypothetical protein